MLQVYVHVTHESDLNIKSHVNRVVRGQLPVQSKPEIETGIVQTHFIQF